MKEDNNDFLDELENMSIEEIEKVFDDIIEFDVESTFLAARTSGCEHMHSGSYSGWLVK